MERKKKYTIRMLTVKELFQFYLPVMFAQVLLLVFIYRANVVATLVLGLTIFFVCTVHFYLNL
jgi:hypothetical protein